MDFKKRAQSITKIEDDIKAALDREKEMKTVIEMYQRKIRKEGLVKWWNNVILYFYYTTNYSTVIYDFVKKK